MSTKLKNLKIKKVLFLCITGVLLFTGITSQAKEPQELTDEKTEESVESGQPSEEVQAVKEVQEVKEVPPAELDLGDYQAEMTIGEKQLLAVTILPMDATASQLSYASSNTEVATINGMGRITAFKEGNTKITVSCGKVSAGFDLKVKEAESTEVAVTELDLGDCPKEITVGTSQMLSVAVIPANATNTSFTYQSSNEAVASVNALGRLTGKQLGTAEITVTCGKVKGKFRVTVVEDSSQEKEVEVQDVEIGDYEEELKVDSTVSLSATVVPSNATDATVTYKSSNPAVATVNSSGEVKGIAAGQAVIYVSAGNITKQAPVTVKIATTAISLNSDYQVMKPNDTFQLKAEVQPAGAAGGITYKSVNPEVASVSASGVITAKSCGNTAIVVSNGDLQVSVTVIVNEEGTAVSEEETNTEKIAEAEHSYPDEVSAKEYPVISTEMLKYFYEKGKVLTIKGDGYTIYLNGKDIVNFENELETQLLFQQEKNGFTLVVNNGKKLCGELTIDISEKITKEKYLYLYNNEKEKYQKIEAKDISTLSIDTAGKYLLTSKPLAGVSVNLILVVIGCLAILTGAGVYIGVKKQYWFW